PARDRRGGGVGAAAARAGCTAGDRAAGALPRRGAARRAAGHLPVRDALRPQLAARGPGDGRAGAGGLRPPARGRGRGRHPGPRRGVCLGAGRGRIRGRRRAAAAAEGGDEPVTREEVRAFLLRRARAWREGDLDAIMADYAPDVVLIAPGVRLEGLDVLRANNERYLAEYT